jgi:hypothetical protein
MLQSDAATVADHTKTTSKCSSIVTYYVWLPCNRHVLHRRSLAMTVSAGFTILVSAEMAQYSLLFDPPNCFSLSLTFHFCGKIVKIWYLFTFLGTGFILLFKLGYDFWTITNRWFFTLFFTCTDFLNLFLTILLLQLLLGFLTACKLMFSTSIATLEAMSPIILTK